MGKKITVVTGSPRKGGNSMLMAESFITAAVERGHEVARFDAAFLKNLAGCRACGACFSKGRPCVIDDDFNDVARSLMESEVWAFAMPVYWYTIPAQIKCVMDRMYCFAVGKREEIKGKRIFVMTCCADDEAEVPEGVTMPFERSARLMHWTIDGTLCVTSVNKPGDIRNTDALAKAAALAEKI